MSVIKSHQADNFVKKPPKSIIACLIYGQDEGRISENAAILARSWLQMHGEGGETIRLGERDLAENPDILAVELGSVSMFGGRSVVRVTACRHLSAPMVKELLAAGPQNFLIVEAGNLKPSSPLRKLFEKGKNTAAIACYADEDRDLGRLVDEEMRHAGMRINADARALLIASLGSDRGVSRRELEKLTLYAHGRESITIEDIEAVIGDSSQPAWDRIINLTLAGKGAQALLRLDYMPAAGQGSGAPGALLLRHLVRLYHLRVMVEKGADAKTAISRLRPPVHFKQRDAMMDQLRRLDARTLERAIRMVRNNILQARRSPHVERPATERMLLAVSHLAARA